MPRRKATGSKEAQALYRRYLKEYGVTAQADKDLFLQLANVQASMRKVEESLVGLEDRGLTSSDNYSDLNQTRVRLSQEARLLQEKLGITRQQRQEEIDAGSEMRKFVDQARDWMRREAIIITCPHCGELPKLHLGFISYPFRERSPWKFSTLCPNCQKPIEIAGGPEQVVMSPGLKGTIIRSPQTEVDLAEKK